MPLEDSRTVPLSSSLSSRKCSPWENFGILCLHKVLLFHAEAASRIERHDQSTQGAEAGLYLNRTFALHQFQVSLPDLDLQARASGQPRMKELARQLLLQPFLDPPAQPPAGLVFRT